MKSEIIGPTAQEFKPFKLNILIENEQDLRELWHRFNLPYTDFYSEDLDFDIKNDAGASQSVYMIWKMLHKEVEARGLS